MAEEKKIVALTRLPNPIELAKESWIIYKARFWTVVGVGLLGYLGVIIAFLIAVVIGVIGFFALGGEFQPTIIGLGTLLAVALIVVLSLLGTWISAALIINIAGWQKKVGVKESYSLAKPFIVPLLLTSVLSALIITGSAFVFIIPAFIFSVWFSFAQYSVVLDKKTGLEALYTSREYVRGRFWKVIWLMVAVHLPEIVISMVIGSAVKNENGTGLNGIFQLVALLAIPFYQMYSYTLFMHLRKTSELKKTEVVGRSTLMYLLVPAIGYLLLIIGAVVIAPTVTKSLGSMGEFFNNYKSLGAEDGTKPGTRIVTGLVVYFVANQEYPESLDVLVDKKILPSVPKYSVSTLSELPYEYMVISDGKDFRLCTPAVVSPKKCVTSKSKDFDL